MPVEGCIGDQARRQRIAQQDGLRGPADPHQVIVESPARLAGRDQHQRIATHLARGTAIGRADHQGSILRAPDDGTQVQRDILFDQRRLHTDLFECFLGERRYHTGCRHERHR